jgi:hypothetical protein
VAICTRNQVLQYIGLSDTSSEEPAIIVQAVTPSGSSTVSQVTLSIASFVLTVTPNVTAGAAISPATFDLLDEDYDTLSELTTALNALGYLNAIRATEDATVPSSLISVDATPIAANTLGTITYDNPTTDSTVGLIDTLIPAVELEFERFTGRKVDAEALDERYDGDGAEVIVLRSAPATVTAVSLIDADGSATTVASTEYYADTERGFLYARSGSTHTYGFVPDGYGDGPARNRAPLYRWPEGTRNVRVQYTGGWSTDSNDPNFVPADLSLAACRRIADLIADRRNNRMMTTDSMQGRMLVRNVASEYATLMNYFGPWRREA